MLITKTRDKCLEFVVFTKCPVSDMVNKVFLSGTAVKCTNTIGIEIPIRPRSRTIAFAMLRKTNKKASHKK
jgi:hypothetical protein